MLHTEIHEHFSIKLILFAQFSSKSALIPQNLLIPPNCILPTYSSTKCFNTSTCFYNSAINIGYISFFSSSEMHQSPNLMERYTSVINSSLKFFVSFLTFSNLKCLKKMLSWIEKKLKQLSWQKNFFLIGIKITIFLIVFLQWCN